MTHSNPKTMTELCEYVKQTKRQRAAVHRRKFAHAGRCSGLTDKEYKSVIHSQKSSFAKARKFTHHAMWRETHEKWDIKLMTKKK